MFKCDKCGECCRNLKMSDVYSDLDRGDGICKYLNGNLCSIYENRPMKCRIDDSYYEFFKDSVTLEEFYDSNYKMCEEFKKRRL